MCLGRFIFLLGSIMRNRDYCMPEFIEDGNILEIEQGRHPVVEMVLKQEAFRFGWYLAICAQ